MLQIAIDHIKDLADGRPVRELMHMMDAHDLAAYLREAHEITDTYTLREIEDMEKAGERVTELEAMVENVRGYAKDLRDNLAALRAAPLAELVEALTDLEENLRDIETEVREEQTT